MWLGNQFYQILSSKNTLWGLCGESDCLPSERIIHVYDLSIDIKDFKCTFTEEGINKNPSEVSAPDTEAGLGSKDSAIAASVGCFIIIIIIIITMTVIRNKKPNFTRACGLQKRVFLCIRHDEDTSDHTEDVI